MSDADHSPDQVGTLPPETGDSVIDTALGHLAAVDDADLDGLFAAGEQVQRTLQARLGNLGG